MDRRKHHTERVTCLRILYSPYQSDTGNKRHGTMKHDAEEHCKTAERVEIMSPHGWSCNIWRFRFCGSYWNGAFVSNFLLCRVYSPLQTGLIGSASRLLLTVLSVCGSETCQNRKT
jgi:hypothetical protein